MNKIVIVIGVALLTWLFVSQGIAWMLSNKNQSEADRIDEVHGLWLAAFLMPFLIGFFILPALLEHRLRKGASKSGLVPPPSDNPMDYL